MSTEPPSVLFPVIVAALSIDYPAHKLRVVVLDDGKRDEVGAFVTNILEAPTTTGCSLEYMARTKDKPHWVINESYVLVRDLSLNEVHLCTPHPGKSWQHQQCIHQGEAPRRFSPHH